MADVKAVKVDGTKYPIKIPSENVKLMTGYSKGSSTDAITPSDSLNSAIGKLECRADKNQDNVLYAIDTGVKNWIPMSRNVLSYNGLSITRTPNEIQISGTSTKTFSLLLTGSAIEQQTSDRAYYDIYSKLPDSVNLSGAPDNQNKNRIIVALYLGTTWVYSFSSQTAMPVDLSNYTYDRWYAYIPIAYGESYSGTWKPFLKDSSITDSTFVPGSLPNSDLTRLEAEDRTALAEEIDASAKNTIKYDMTQLAALNPSWTVSGSTIRPSSDTHITFTLNSDMSIRVQSDGSNAQAELCICTSTYSPLKAGTYVLSGCPTGGDSSTTYDLRLIEQSSPKKYNADKGSGYEIAWSAQYTYTCNIMVRANQNIDITFEPMVCTLADWKVSQKFAPYRVPITGLTAVNRSISCSTTETSTGIKFVATKTAMYKITVTAHYGASKPLSLRIKQKVNASASTYPFIVVKSTDDSIALTTTGIMTLGVGGEFEIFATYASAANNNIYMLVEELG